jgi:hypothetical protein
MMQRLRMGNRSPVATVSATMRPRRTQTGVRGIQAIAAIVSLLTAFAACSLQSAPTPGLTILPGPTGAAKLTEARLRLVLIDQLGPLWHCDRDQYPVGRNEREAALVAWPEMQGEAAVFRAVAATLGVNVDREVDEADKLEIYRLWKVAIAIELDSVGDGAFRFDYLAQPVEGAAQGLRSAGVIRESGEITIEQQAPADEPICPICLARGTPIDTPAGPVAVERLRLGDPIWTLTTDGRRVAGSVSALGSTAAPADHVVVRLVLEDGRAVTASPGHPLADGRLIGDLRPGDAVDGSRVATAIRQPYASQDTFDLVSSGETGAYLAGGIALGSTLVPR